MYSQSSRFNLALRAADAAFALERNAMPCRATKHSQVYALYAPLGRPAEVLTLHSAAMQIS